MGILLLLCWISLFWEPMSFSFLVYSLIYWCPASNISWGMHGGTVFEILRVWKRWLYSIFTLAGLNHFFSEFRRHFFLSAGVLCWIWEAWCHSIHSSFFSFVNAVPWCGSLLLIGLLLTGISFNCRFISFKFFLFCFICSSWNSCYIKILDFCNDLRAAVPSRSGTRDQFYGRQFFQGRVGGWFRNDSSSLHSRTPTVQRVSKRPRPVLSKIGDLALGFLFLLFHLHILSFWWTFSFVSSSVTDFYLELYLKASSCHPPPLSIPFLGTSVL